MAERKPKIGVVIHTTLAETMFAPEDRARLNALGEVRWTESAEPIDEADAIALLQGCQVGIGSWGTPCPTSDALVRACPDLVLWEHAAGTVRAMLTPLAAEQGLVVASCKTAIADTVAEMALGEILIGLRRILENREANRAGATPMPTGIRSLDTATIGVVGASAVGRRLIHLLKACGSRHILVYDPFLADADAAALGVTRTDDLLRLCREADAVTVHAPSLPSTEKMLGAEHFRAMADDAVFVNTARGSCIDEAALVAELAKGRLLAFIDVTDPEPAAADSPLRTLPNVVLTSHIAGAPWLNIGRQAVDDVAAFLSGGRPKAVQSRDLLDRIA
ncbi:MAG TPA: hydroxyacid dehydrogenase [Phycisphaerae bacterium]|nr:hydroxyacid dehydrogenase [Phycisphaerae bacterium]